MSPRGRICRRRGLLDGVSFDSAGRCTDDVVSAGSRGRTRVGDWERKLAHTRVDAREAVVRRPRRQ